MARRLDDWVELTGTGAAVGTPHSMSHEQARGERNLGPASDVFALGSVLYECLTGARPFETAHPIAVLMMICIDAPTPIGARRSGVPRDVERLVHAMLSKAPAARPGLRVLARELDGLLPALRADPSRDATRVGPKLSAALPSLVPGPEQRVLSALLVGCGGASGSVLDAALDGLLPAYGARGDRLLDGSRLLLFDRYGMAGEQVLAATRLALDLRPVAPVPLLVCTGRATVDRAGAALADVRARASVVGGCRMERRGSVADCGRRKRQCMPVVQARRRWLTHLHPDCCSPRMTWCSRWCSRETSAC
jgi:hypothetical protein